MRRMDAACIVLATCLLFNLVLFLNYKHGRYVVFLTTVSSIRNRFWFKYCCEHYQKWGKCCNFLIFPVIKILILIQILNCITFSFVSIMLRNTTFNFNRNSHFKAYKKRFTHMDRKANTRQLIILLIDLWTSVLRSHIWLGTIITFIRELLYREYLPNHFSCNIDDLIRPYILRKTLKMKLFLFRWTTCRENNGYIFQIRAKITLADFYFYEIFNNIFIVLFYALNIIMHGLFLTFLT